VYKTSTSSELNRNAAMAIVRPYLSLISLTFTAHH